MKTTKAGSKSALEKHIEYFGGNQPEGITYSSIYEQNRRLGDNPIVAAANAALVSGAVGFKLTGCPYSMFKAKQGVGVLNHAYSTKIFNLDGSINEERWNQLLNYSGQDETGQKIIREDKFYEFLNACRQEETSNDIMARVASNGEWSAYFAHFGEKDKDGRRFVTVQKLRDFYEDSAKVGKDLEDKVKSSSTMTL